MKKTKVELKKALRNFTDDRKYIKVKLLMILIIYITWKYIDYKLGV